MSGPSYLRSPRGFTLVELLVVIVILALMAALAYPGLQNSISKARSTQCASNLRVIGLAVMQAASDNDNQYPEISQAATDPYPSGSGAKNLYDTLSPYGVTKATLRCPVDAALGPASAYQMYGSSYEWNPSFDDEVTVTPIIYWSATVSIPVNSSHVRLCTDFNALHSGRMNILYGDGHVRAH